MVLNKYNTYTYSLVIPILIVILMLTLTVRVNAILIVIVMLILIVLVTKIVNHKCNSKCYSNVNTNTEIVIAKDNKLE